MPSFFSISDLDRVRCLQNRLLRERPDLLVDGKLRVTFEGQPGELPAHRLRLRTFPLLEDEFERLLGSPKPTRRRARR